MSFWLAHGALLTTTLFFSAWNVLASAFQGLGGAFLLVAARDSIALTLLVTAGLVLRGSAVWWASALKGSRDWCLIAVVGLSGPCIAPIANVLCVVWAGSDTTGIFNGLSPAAAGVLALLLGYERLTPRLVVGLVLGCTGAVLATQGASSSQDAAGQGGGPRPAIFALGIVAGVVVAFSAGLFVIVLPPLMARSRNRPPLDTQTVLTAAYHFSAAASLLLCLGVSLCMGDGGPASLLHSWTTQDTLLALYSGGICGALNYALITWSTKVLPATVVCLYGALQPTCTAVFAFLLRGEAISVWGAGSAVLVTLSICILAFNQPPQPSAPCPPETGATPEQERAPFNPDPYT